MIVPRIDRNRRISKGERS